MQTHTQQIPDEKSSVSIAAVPQPSVFGQGILRAGPVKTPEEQLRDVVDTIPTLAWSSSHPNGAAAPELH
jgi:hypothetical protein